MSDEKFDDGMDTIDEDISENAVPDVDNEADAMAQATVAAAKMAVVQEDEESADGQVDEMEDGDLWNEFDSENKHVTVDNPVYKRQKVDPYSPALSALKVGADELTKILQSRGLIDLTEEQIDSLSKSDLRLVNLTRNLSNIWQDLYFDNIDKEGDWGQFVPHGESRLGPGKVRPENMKDPILAIRASFGQGSVVQIPLWNTGLWISFRAPTVSALLDFDTRSRAEKINLGRSTNGLAYSNSEVYTVEAYMQFALEHVVSVNYKFETSDTVQELMDVISARDYQQVIWGLLCAMYPDGYPFRQPCVANPDACSHIDELVLNFARMGFVDRSKFTDNQKLLMASRRSKRDRKWLEEYQKQFTFFEKRVTLNDSLTAVLRVPTLSEQIDAGHVWVNGIIDATNSAFGHQLSEMERVKHIMRSGVLSNLRQYSHWVSHFEHTPDPDDAPRIIDSLEDKDRLLDLLSEDPEISTMLNNEIIEWLRTSTVSYVALPKIKCPSCQGEPSNSEHPYLIPLDVGYIFFTLAAFKINLIEGAAGTI